MQQNQLNNLYEERNRILYLIHDRINRLHQKHNTHQSLLQQLANLEVQLQSTWPSITQTEATLRELYAITAGYLACQDWQSPSFLDTGIHQAGSQHKRITQAVNDYKRDQHLDGIWYESQFRKEYIHYSFFKPVRIYATNSGMAAFSTILGFLQGQKIIGANTIAVGKHSYFEHRLLLKKLFPEQIVFFNENNHQEISALIQEKHPAVWFIDTLSNDHSLTYFQFEQFNTLLKSVSQYNPFVVIDNTCLSLFCQPFTLHNRPKNLIVWESLLKYHQFGLDRVNGGIIYAQCYQASELYTYRDHLGTNISDYAVHALPKPNKEILRNRLLRHQQNQQILTTILQSTLYTTKLQTQWTLVSPSTESRFTGSQIVLLANTVSNPLDLYKRLLHRVIAYATASGVQCIGGTSFGFSTTRFYIPASRPGQGTPFFRISVGTEPVESITKIGEALCKALLK